jgi:HlyD family secretion protein
MTLRRKFYLFAGLIGGGALVATFGIRNNTHATSIPPPAAQSRPASVSAVGCEGRIEPANGLIRIAAGNPSGGAAILEALGIAEQQHVSKGQWIGTLRGKSLVQAALRLSEQKIATAGLKLEQLRAAPKENELASRSEEIERRRVEYERANTELERYQLLRKAEDVSASDLETRRANAEMARHSLQQAQQDRLALAELRQPDEAVLVSGIREAEAEKARLEAELHLYDISSPVSGTVLKLTAHVGESVGPAGIAEILEDGPLYAIAEVAEADISRLRIGNPAEVKGELLPLEAAGVVESIGGQVSGSEVLSSDPSAFTDKRIVPVKIRLSGAGRAMALIHTRVSIRIATQ